MSGLRSKNRHISHGNSVAAGAIFGGFGVALEAGMLRCLITPGTATTAAITATRGGVSVTMLLDNGEVLAAQQAHVFDIPCSSDFEYDLLIGTPQASPYHFFLQEIQT